MWVRAIPPRHPGRTLRTLTQDALMVDFIGIARI